MGLETINREQFDAFVQVLKKRISELDQEIKLPSYKRRIDREIEFDKKLIVQSLNAILRFKDQREIRTSLIKNNLFGTETLELLAQFLGESEGQQQDQEESAPTKSAERPPQTSTAVETVKEPPVTLKPRVETPVIEKKEAPQIAAEEPPAKAVEARQVVKEEEPVITADESERTAGVKSKVEEAPIFTEPVKLPEPEVGKPSPSSQEPEISFEPVLSTEEGEPAQPEPVVQTPETPAQESTISQAPFRMLVMEREVPTEEPAAMAEEPGVPWNGTPREGNIFKGLKASYQLERQLNAGKYGEVWKAVVVEASQNELQGKFVALKVANPGLTFEEKLQFEAEIDILDELRKHAPKDLLLIEGRSVVPEVLEFVQDPTTPPQRAYFTETLAVGKPINKLRRRNNRLPEPVALEITAQFCRVLQAVHEGLQMSLVNFEPEKFFWDEEKQRIFVAGWRHSSKPEQADSARDLVTAAGELYQMVMGVPPPIPGSHRALAEPFERWNELSLGVQDILGRAFNPFRPYQSAGEMRRDLEWLGEWWKRDGKEALGQFKHLLQGLPQNEQTFEKEHSEQAAQVFWAAGVLEKLAARPENVAETWVREFHDLKKQLDKWQTGAYWLRKGKESFEIRSWEVAEKDFNQALKDTRHALEARRWLQAVKAGRSKEIEQKAGGVLDIAWVEEAINLLQQGNFAEAAPIFEQLAAEESRGDFEILAAEARLRESLQRVPGLLEEKRYKELAEVYHNAIQWMDKLPQGYQDLLGPGFEDFKSKEREYTSRYQKLQELQERFEQLMAAREGEFSEYYRRLKELLDQQPGNIELLGQGKEEIFQLLSQGKYAEGRALAALCLDYGCEADPYLHQVWQYACQLERSWKAWAQGNGPAFRNAMLNQAWPSELWAKLVEKILEKSLELPDEYFVAEFLDEICSASKISYENPKIQEQIKLEKARLLSKIDEAFQADEEAGAELLLNLIQAHPYSLTLFNTAAAKVGAMLQQNNFSAALRIAQVMATQFSIRELKGETENLAQIVSDLRSFLNAARRILPLQEAWSDNGAVGLAHKLELESPWSEDRRWGENELVFLRDFLTRCFEKLEKEFLGWNLVLAKVDRDDPLYLRLDNERDDLHQEFKKEIQRSLQMDPQPGLEALRVLWFKYPMDPILEQVLLEVLDHDFLFQDENAQKAHKIFYKLSEFPQALKERIDLSAKNAQYYRMHPESPEVAYIELLDKLSGSGKIDQLSKEKKAFLEAVRHVWFREALQKEDLAALQKNLTLLPKDQWSKAEIEALNNLRKTYTQSVQTLTESTNEALKKGEQLEQQPVGLAAKLMGKLQKQPSLEDTLTEWNGIMESLRTWIEKTRQAGWNEESFRLESYLEKLTKLYTRIELLTARKSSDANLTVIAELWKLALPGTPEDPMGEPKETPKASEENRRLWLLQMDKACQELLRTFPKDSQKQVWTGWQTRIQAELRKIQRPS